MWGLFLCDLAEAALIRAGRGSGVALEERAEEGHILVADGFADLLHGAMVALQHTAGGGHP